MIKYEISNGSNSDALTKGYTSTKYARELLAILVFNGFYSSLIMYGQMCELQFLFFVLQNPPLLCLHICLSLVKVNVTRLVQRPSKVRLTCCLSFGVK